MMSTQPSRLPPRLWKLNLLSGALAVVLGLAVSAWTGIATLAASVLAGCYLVISALAQFLIASSPGASAVGRIVLFASGGASLILTGLALSHRDQAILLVATWIGIGLVLRSAASIVSVISDSSLPRRGWQTSLGVFGVVAGILVLALPIESVGVVGILLCAVGCSEVVTGFAIRRPKSRHSMGAMFGDVRMLSHEVGLMNPVARAIWRLLGIDGLPSRYRSDPRGRYSR